MLLPLQLLPSQEHDNFVCALHADIVSPAQPEHGGIQHVGPTQSDHVGIQHANEPSIYIYIYKYIYVP